MLPYYNESVGNKILSTSDKVDKMIIHDSVWEEYFTKTEYHKMSNASKTLITFNAIISDAKTFPFPKFDSSKNNDKELERVFTILMTKV